MSISLMVSDTFRRRYQAELDRLAGIGPGLDVRVLTPERNVGTDGEVVFLSPDEYPEAPSKVFLTALRAPSLRWFHSMSAGVDHPAFTSLRDRGVLLTTSSGSSAEPIAHAVFLHLLALTRHFRVMARHQSDGLWERVDGVDLLGRRLVIAGMGPIGMAVARLGTAFGMVPLGLRRTVRGDEPCETWTLDRWHEAVPLADALVLALPLTPETRHLLDAPALGLLRPSSYVVNVGRGDLIDELALIDALEAGRIAGAGLDVAAKEPLPPESPLWRLPNVVITPHNSAAVPSTADAACRIFLDNLQRYLVGAPLRNIATS